MISTNPESGTTYTVTGFDGLCTNTAAVTVSALPYPVISLQYPLNAQCHAAQVTLSASGATYYQWEPANLLSSASGSLVSTVPLSTSSVFTVTGLNSIGSVSCSAQSTLMIDVLQSLAVSISPSVEICEGSQAALYVTGGNTWQWSGQNVSDPFAQGVMVAPFSSAVYSVQASYNYVCPVTATVFVKVNPKPFLFAGNDTTINIGDAISLNAQSTGTVYWINGEQISCRDCRSPFVYPFTRTCYMVETVNHKGCRAQDEVCVEVVNDYNIYIPNTFTPDGDGLNDIFSIHGYGIKNYSLSVYNRWGELLFSSEHSQGWDGKYKGMPCEQGVYVYKADVQPLKGKLQQRAGHVTLLR